MKTVKILSTFALGSALLAGSSTGAWAHGASKHIQSKHIQKTHVQNVTIVATGSGYSPSMVNVKAGQPVRMTFVSKGSGCTNGIRIPALKQSIDLKRGQQKQIVFTPKKGQTIAFVCEMNMFKGKVVAH